VILLNAQNHYLLAHLVSTGTQSSSLVHPREVLGPALREGASALILIHNHPSGEATPSREDTRLTRQLVEAAQLMDLRIHDHVIIGNGSHAWVSLAACGLGVRRWGNGDEETVTRVGQVSRLRRRSPRQP